jgi:Ran GTPase-activating protein (RanGAP) involved in mRNA processing and transport
MQYHKRQAKQPQGAKRHREQTKAKTVDLSTKPVRFYISRKGKVFPVRVLFQGETKYGERAKVCMMNEKNPDENAWWCDSGNLYQSKREALQAMEDRENETPEEDEDQEGDEEEQEEGEESEEGEVPF